MLSWFLPDDVVVEILARLHVRCLVRFKCVAKSWSALCRDPSFIKKQEVTTTTTSSKSPPHLLFHHPRKSLLSRACGCAAPPTLELNKYFKRNNIASRIQILGPCNGIFCLVGSFRGCQRRNSTCGYEIVLWNPATRETKHAPEVMPRQTHGMTHHTNFGFGIDPNTNDFKVVKVFELEIWDTCPLRRHEVSVEVYNLSTNSWRQIPCELEPLTGRPLFRGRCSLNGIQYWLTECAGDMLSFHFGEEVFRWIKLPNSSKFGGAINIAVYNDFLLCITQLFGFAFVWVMHDIADHVCWTQLCSTDYMVTNLLTVWEDDLVFLDNDNRLIWYYNLGTEISKTTLLKRGCSEAFSYRETLVGISG